MGPFVFGPFVPTALLSPALLRTALLLDTATAAFYSIAFIERCLPRVRIVIMSQDSKDTHIFSIRATLASVFSACQCAADAATFAGLPRFSDDFAPAPPAGWRTRNFFCTGGSKNSVQANATPETEPEIAKPKRTIAFDTRLDGVECAYSSMALHSSTSCFTVFF